jgi:uncharacterized phage-associated protein
MGGEAGGEITMDIRSEQELIAIMEQKAGEAMEAAADEIHELFQREYVLKHVYDSHGGNMVYHAGMGQPTLEFMEAWVWTPLRKEASRLVKEMWYNPSTMSFNIDTFLHGSKYSRPENVKASLMDILNKKGYSSSLWLSVYRPIAYWDKFISDMFDNGKLERILSKHFLEKGFTKI